MGYGVREPDTEKLTGERLVGRNAIESTCGELYVVGIECEREGRNGCVRDRKGRTGHDCNRPAVRPHRHRKGGERRLIRGVARHKADHPHIELVGDGKFLIPARERGGNSLPIGRGHCRGGRLDRARKVAHECSGQRNRHKGNACGAHGAEVRARRVEILNRRNRGKRSGNLLIVGIHLENTGVVGNQRACGNRRVERERGVQGVDPVNDLGDRGRICVVHKVDCLPDVVGLDVLDADRRAGSGVRRKERDVLGGYDCVD